VAPFQVCYLLLYSESSSHFKQLIMKKRTKQQLTEKNNESGDELLKDKQSMHFQILGAQTCCAE